MMIAFQLLILSILLVTDVLGSRCTELNFRAAGLQSDNLCTLLRYVISGDDILAGDTTGDMADIVKTCGFHLEGVDRPTCVEEVVDVVAGLRDEGCEVTGG